MSAASALALTGDNEHIVVQNLVEIQIALHELIFEAKDWFF